MLRNGIYYYLHFMNAIILNPIQYMKSLFVLFSLIFVSSFSCVHSAVPIHGAMTQVSDSVTSLVTDSVSRDSILLSIELTEVTATAAGNNRDAVTESYIVTDEMRRGNTSAIALLDRLPGVTVNLIDESIRVGKERDVKIIVNGREMNSDFAKSINPKRIFKIEIQRYPPGQFSDCPVVINIVLKRYYAGWDTSLQGLGLLSMRNRNSNVEQGVGSATVSIDRWSFYAQLTGLNKRMYQSTAFATDILDRYSEETAPVDRRHPNNRTDTRRGNIFAGFDFRINENHHLSGQFSGDIARNASSTSDRVTSMLDNVEENFNRLSASKYFYHQYSAGAFYRGSFNDRLNLVAQLTYDYFSTHDRQSYTDTRGVAPQSALTLTDGDKNYLNLELRGSYVLSRVLTLDLSNTLTTRDYESRTRDSQEGGYKSDELRNLLNLNATWNPRSNLSINAGAKLLTVKENIKTLDRQRTSTSVMPFGRLYWRFYKDLSLSFNYFNMIDYPVLDRLSTETYAVSPYLYTSGNPLLKSQIMNYGEIEIGYKSLIKLNYMLKFADREITDFYIPVDNDHILHTYTNCNYRHSYLGVSSDFELFKEWNWSLTANVQWYKRYSGDLSATGRTYYLDVMTYYVIKPLQLMVNCSYFLRHDKRPLLQGKEYVQEEQLAIGLRRSFFNSRLVVALQGTIPVQAISKIGWRKIDIPGYRTQSWTDDRVNQSLLMLNIRFAIGNGKSRKTDNSLATEKEKDI